MDDYDVDELSKTEEGRQKISKVVLSRIDNYLKHQDRENIADNPFLYYILQEKGIVSMQELQVIMELSLKYSLSALRGSNKNE